MSDHGQRLQQTQQLQQRLLPQQVRFARMLELTEGEVEQEVERELEENPALERRDTPAVSAPSYYNPARRPDSDAPDPGSLAVAREATLSEILDSQLRELDLEPRVRLLAEYMTGSLDTNGYFTRTIPQMAADAALATDGALDPTGDEMREAWRAIRSLDPPGVGAMDLRDCLLLQLDRMTDDSPALADAREIVRHYFDIFSHRNFQALAAETGLSAERIKAADALIVTLNPKPAASISGGGDTDPVAGVTPDFIVETDGERLSVAMPNSLPELVVEESFEAADSGSSSENAFVRTSVERANSFIEMIARRRRTLMAVVKAIVNIQRDFFIGGDDETLIRPMVLRDVAAATGLDVSTVSRATAGKWLSTALGVYSLKSFFNEKVADTSSHEVMAEIRSIIEDENPSKPVSDDEIAAILGERGLKIARRTVAKYRDRMGFPSARLRRKA